MKRFGVLVAVVIAMLAVTLPAYAFNCPVVIMQAEELIKKAEAKVTPETRGFVDDAKKMLVEARAHHESAKTKRDHADAIRKAKIASALAEEAITLQSP
jgi:putative Ca2+/H+ antiporter (TMEM165/GDT1 family)